MQAQNPAREVVACRERALELQRRLAVSPAAALAQARQRFRQGEGMLRVLGPEATLGRGYSITTATDGRIIRSVAAVATGARVRTRLADGTFEAEVIA